MHTITCDGCKVSLEDGEGGTPVFYTAADAWAAALDEGWTTTGHRHYCPGCIKDPPGGES